MKKLYRSILLIMIIALLALSCSKSDTNINTAIPVSTNNVSEPIEIEPKEGLQTVELISLSESSAEENITIALGEKMPDFSFVDFNGNEHTLYSILEEKDCVLINLFTSWCGPCRKEFPALEGSYEEYKDRVEVIALSVEEEDSFEVLSEYASDLGLTFLVGRDELQFYEILLEPGFPTSIVIDKFGNVSLIESGAVTVKTYFDSLFEYYLSDSYTETEILYEFPDIVSTEPLLDVEDLAAALDVNSDRIRLENPQENTIWPMTITEYNGQSVLAATNSIPMSYSEIKAIINGEENEGFSISCAMPNNSISSHGMITVDGEVVKYFINSEDFETFTYQFKRSGEHEVSITSWINVISTVTGDTDISIYYNSLKYLNEEETIEGLKNNPAYPTGEGELSLIISDDSKVNEINIIGLDEISQPYYLTEEDTISFTVNVGENMDPENLYVYSFVFNTVETKIVRLVDLYEDGKFSFSLDMPEKIPLGIMRVLIIDTNAQVLDGYNLYSCEEAVNIQVELLMYNSLTSMDWEFTDPNLVKKTKMKTLEEILNYEEEELSTEASYTVKYVDQYGDPIVGIMLQVCDDTLCQVFISDANGLCTFTLPPYEYELHTLMVPSGYDADSTVYKTKDTGDDIVIVINKH